MKKFCLLLALMLALTASSALAEEAVRLWDAIEIKRDSNEAHDNVVIIRSEETRLYGVAALDGTIRIEPVHKAISGLIGLADYYRIVDGEGANRYSVLDAAGQHITTDTYISVEAKSDKWLICVRAIPAENEEQGWEFQVFSGGTQTNYIAERYDIYYLPEAKLVGQLTREEFRMSKAYGDYLLVEDDAHQYQLYDAAFTPVETNFRATVDYEFTGVEGAIVSRITGEVIATGYRFHSGLTEDLMSVSLYKDSTGMGIMNRQGEIMLEPVYSYIRNKEDYGVLLVEKDGLRGAFDPDTLTLDLPCAYSDVLRGYNVGGVKYYLVEQDGVVGYATGEGVTVMTACAEGDVKLFGASLCTTAEDGTLTLIAADGTVTPLDGVAEVQLCERTQGRYIQAKNAEGLWGLMNWHGEMVADFCEKYAGAFQFVDDSHFIYRDAMYKIQ